MTENSDGDEEVADRSSEAPEQAPKGSAESVGPPTESEQGTAPWKAIALIVVGGLAIATASSLVTLAATHNSAVAANARAYVNGLMDGLAANTRTYLEGLADGFDLGEFSPVDDWLLD